MAEIRISKLAKQFSIGVQTLVEFLNEKGAGLGTDPNAKISDEYLPAIEAKFGEDLKLKKDAENVVIKLKDIVERGAKKKNEQEEEEIVEKEIVIKTNTLNSEAAPSVEKRPEPEPVKDVAQVAGRAATEKVAENRSEEKGGLKILGKIDLDKMAKPSPAEKPAEEAVASPAAEPVARPEAKPEAKPVAGADARAAAGADAGADARQDARPLADSKPERQEFTKAEAPAKTPAAEAPQAAKPEAAVKEEPKPEVRPEPREIKVQVERLQGPKVVDKIDLSQFDKKKKKRERIEKGGREKVDVTKVDASNNSKKDKNKGGKDQKFSGKGSDQQASGKNNKKSRRDRGGEKFKPAMTEAEAEEMQKEIQKQIKETYARMNEGKSKNNFGAKHRKEKRELASQRMQEEMELQQMEQKVLKVTEFVTVNDLATLMNNTPVTKVIAACMSLGMMVSINQRLDAETLVLVAEEFGYEVEFVTANLTEAINQSEEDADDRLESRPPVITVMGHVDHGKTSLLDYIRKANVIAGEAGGITQHIGAYNVKLPDGRRITFLDTPGHEAFTAMRARGAQLTDLAIIIVAADDAVMPQTVEAINHAQAANVPMVFAINKIDKPGANPDTIRRQLSEMNILVEDWGGKYQCQEISAKKGLNVDKLLEKVLLETDILDLKANPNKPAIGAVIESSLDKGRGYLATVLVQEGTLRQGDVVLCGSYYGRVKSMFNERGQKVTEAGPSTPVSVLGLNGAPAAGEKFNVLADEKEAKNIANKREQLLRIQGIKTQKHMTLEEIGRRIAIGNFKELNIIVKGDVDGSVEALSDSLIKLSTEEVKVNVIHKAVGGISESDVLLAEASDAVIVGFQVRPTVEARKAADREGIEIRLYSVIYDCINEVKDGIEGMLEPEKKEEVIATAEVKQTFRISKVGTIAGCLVRDGKMVQKSKVRLIRDGIVVYTGELGSLQVGKDAVKEVIAGRECGLSIAGYNDIKDGDVIEAFQIVEIKRTL